MNEKQNKCGRPWKRKGRRTCKGFSSTFLSCKFYKKDAHSNAKEWCEFYNDDFISNIGECVSLEAIADAELTEKLEDL